MITARSFHDPPDDRRKRAVFLCWAMAAIVGFGCSPSAPPPGELAYQRGLNALAEQRFDWARRHFAEVSAESPRYSEALRLSGHAWLQGPLQALQPAVTSYRRYLQLHPDDAEVRYRLARCYDQMGESGVALEWLDGLSAEAMDRADSVDAAQLTLLRARLLLETEPQTSLEWVRPMLQDPVHGFRAWAVASQAHSALGEDVAALDAALESLALNPLQERTLYRLSRLHVRQGQLPEAQAAVQRSRDVASMLDHDAKTPTERLRQLRALTPAVDMNNRWVLERSLPWLMAVGELDAVRSAMQALRSVDGASVGLQLDFELLLWQQGLRHEAAALLESLRQEHGDDRRVRYRWLQRLLARGELEEAERRVQESLRDEGHLARYHVVQARLHILRERPDAAAEAMEIALELAPWMAEWRQQLVRLQIDAGRLDAARSTLDAAPEPHPVLDAMRRRHGFGAEAAR